MKSFLKYTLATILGIIITTFIMVLIFFGIIGSIISKQEKPVTIKSNSVLVLKLDKPIQDRKPVFSFTDFNLRFEPEIRLGLNEILANIEKAKEDSKIKGIWLDLSTLQTGISTIEEMREALINFKTSGKFIIAYSDQFNQPTYYLASAADKIYMNPAGYMPFVGLRAELMFFKGTLEKLDIEPQIVRHGKFKSAVEPFIYEKMSSENRKQIKTYVGSIWNIILQDISKARNIPAKSLNDYADRLTLNTPRSLVEYKLIDSLLYKDEVLHELKTLSGTNTEKELNLVNLEKYERVPGVRDYKGLARDKVAVIYASGSVVMGEESERNIGSDGISKAIRKARKDTSVKAIVFRVNSGGGSALASEVIWRELELAKRIKPVVASLGDVAASGGYYIACPADTILANPTSVTGSIGVFGVFLNAKGFLNNKLGITTDVENTNDYADFGSAFRSLKPLERKIIENMIDSVYNTFVSHVAQGRNMDPEKVNDIGQGRIWSGVNALDTGLIDMHGGLSKAIETAVAMAQLETYRIEELPKLEDPFQKLLNDLTKNMQEKAVARELGDAYIYYKNISTLKSLQGIQARLPFEIYVY